MKVTLVASLAFLLAACGGADSDNDRNGAPSVENGNSVIPPETSDAPTVAPDPRRIGVIAAVVETVGAIDRSARTAIGYADIGGDEREEALVYLVDPGQCGSGGCSLIILTPSGKSWRALGRTSVTQLPVHRLLTRSDGWNDLAVGIRGGGTPTGTALLRFSGGHYPSNPSSQPILNRLPEGARLLIPDNPGILSPAR